MLSVLSPELGLDAKNIGQEQATKRAKETAKGL